MDHVFVCKTSNKQIIKRAANVRKSSHMVISQQHNYDCHNDVLPLESLNAMLLVPLYQFLA